MLEKITLSTLILLSSVADVAFSVRTFNATLAHWSGFHVHDLPFAVDALEPHLDPGIVQARYRTHVLSTITALNEAIDEDFALRSLYARDSLDQVVTRSWQRRATDLWLYHMAAQSLNHMFFWQGVVPDLQTSPSGKLSAAIDASFGSASKFVAAWKSALLQRHDSGWVWLLHDKDCNLRIASTADSEHPSAAFPLETPILNMDTSEQLYGGGNASQRGSFVDVYMNKLVNWPVVEERFYRQCRNLRTFIADVSMYHLYL